MTQINPNIKGRCFSHLTEIERGKIAAYLDEGLSIREIGRRLERAASTISRERRHGSVRQIDTNRKPYTKCFPDVGSRAYDENRANCGVHSTVMKAWELTCFCRRKNPR